MEFFLEHPALLTYLFLKISTLNTILLVAAFAGSVLLFIAYMVYSIDVRDYTSEQKTNMFRWSVVRNWTILYVFIVLLNIVLPTQKDVAIIIAATATTEAYKALSESETTKKGLKIIELKVAEVLDETLEEITSKKKSHGR